MSESDPEPADLRALRLLLRQSKDFRLAIALYNDPVQRDGWIRTLADDIGKDGVRVLTLDLLRESSGEVARDRRPWLDLIREADRERGLLDRVQALVAGGSPGHRFAIMVVNMETAVDYAPELSQPGGPGTAFLDAVNLQRELFPKACPGPLVLWMTETLEQAFIRCAPDLWSWRNHVFDLRTRIVPAEPVFDSDGQPFSGHDHRLHPQTRLRRLEEELAAYRRTGSRRDEMRVLTAIGHARLDQGDARLAQLDFDEVLRIARELGDRRWEGSALGDLGIVQFHIGDPRKAIEYYEQALVNAREIGNRVGEGNALMNLGNAYDFSGDAHKAVEFQEQALSTFRAIRNRGAEAMVLMNLGIAHRSLGDPRKAIEYYEQSLVVARETGDRRGQGSVLGNLGNAHSSFGDARKAIEFYEQQLEITREIGDRRGEANALWNSALAHEYLGNSIEAIALAVAALPVFESIGSPVAAKVRAKLAKWRGPGDGSPKIG